jgi:hypothetical protein
MLIRPETLVCEIIKIIQNIIAYLLKKSNFALLYIVILQKTINNQYSLISLENIKIQVV